MLIVVYINKLKKSLPIHNGRKLRIKLLYEKVNLMITQGKFSRQWNVKVLNFRERLSFCRCQCKVSLKFCDTLAAKASQNITIYNSMNNYQLCTKNKCMSYKRHVPGIGMRMKDNHCPSHSLCDSRTLFTSTPPWDVCPSSSRNNSWPRFIQDMLYYWKLLWTKGT